MRLSLKTLFKLDTITLGDYLPLDPKYEYGEFDRVLGDGQDQIISLISNLNSF